MWLRSWLPADKKSFSCAVCDNPLYLNRYYYPFHSVPGGERRFCGENRRSFRNTCQRVAMPAHFRTDQLLPSDTDTLLFLSCCASLSLLFKSISLRRAGLKAGCPNMRLSDRFQGAGLGLQKNGGKRKFAVRVASHRSA